MTDEVILDLHSVATVEDLQKLLHKGYNINERNEFDETPLLCAVRNGRESQLIEEFLKCGADPDIEDCWGRTPLYCAVMNQGSTKVLKCLLQSGADIKGGKSVSDRALECAFTHNRTCAELLLKYKFVKNSRFVKDFKSEEKATTKRDYHLEYKDVVDLNLKPFFYRYFSKFLDDCACEILSMKSVELRCNYSLLDFLANKNSLEELGQEFMDQICKVPNLNCYSIYYSMIATKIGREYLLKYINEKLLRVNFSVSPKPYGKESQILNPDAMYCIAKYLTDIDLLNLIRAHC